MDGECKRDRGILDAETRRRGDAELRLFAVSPFPRVSVSGDFHLTMKASDTKRSKLKGFYGDTGVEMNFLFC